MSGLCIDKAKDRTITTAMSKSNNCWALTKAFAKSVGLFFQLTRCYNYATAVFAGTAIAFWLADEGWGTRFLLSTLANLLAMIAGYIFNDAEDVLEDQLHPHKVQRNVIASGKLTKSHGYILSALAAGASLLLTAPLGSQAIIPTLVALLSLFLYSWRKVRFKSRPVLDLVIYGGIGGLLFVAAFLPNYSGEPLGPEVILVALSFSVGWALSLVHHQLLDIDHDRETNLRTTTAY